MFWVSSCRALGSGGIGTGIRLAPEPVHAHGLSSRLTFRTRAVKRDPPRAQPPQRARYAFTSSLRRVLSLDM